MKQTACVLGVVLVCSSACEMEVDETTVGELTAAVVDSSSHSNGVIGTVSGSGTIDRSAANPFFASLGSNGRTCGSCHLERAGWSITPAIARSVASADPNDPLFDPVDGTDCPIAQNGNPTKNSTELLDNGNIRIELAIPSTADFTLNGYADPHVCAVKPSASRLYLYRRPLPSTNVLFLPTVMWDGRESVLLDLSGDLARQANDATLGHAEATAAIAPEVAQAIVDFELPLFSAQTKVKIGTELVDLTSAAVSGGPEPLASTVGPAFFVGINDTFDPAFDREAFTLFRNWEPSAPQSGLTSLQKSIGRGEHIFNTRVFNITGVGGLNGPLDASQAPIAGTCTTCHNSPEVGNHSSPLPINIGVSDASLNSPAGKTLNIKHLPIYSFRSKVTGQVITVTDPGRALISGRFRDIGKMKGPILRGLAAREPLFHNGSATVAQAVNFYNARFNIGLSSQDKTDLIHFLKSL
jgi:cytochrome c peroxidase